MNDVGHFLSGWPSRRFINIQHSLDHRKQFSHASSSSGMQKFITTSLLIGLTVFAPFVSTEKPRKKKVLMEFGNPFKKNRKNRVGSDRFGACATHSCVWGGWSSSRLLL